MEQKIHCDAISGQYSTTEITPRSDHLSPQNLLTHCVTVFRLGSAFNVEMSI